MIAAMETYLAVRRLAGFTLSNTECLLRSFAAFARDRGESIVRTTTVLAWASQGPSLAQRHRRYETVRQFAMHAQLDDPQHEAPPAHYFGYRTTRRPPRLYTPTEIDQLLVVAAQLTPRDSLRPHTYVALISLLAATGLRISEALALQVADLSGSDLLIRTTKFQKTRLVPLHGTAVAGLEQYLRHPARPPSTRSWVFVSEWGHRLLYRDVHAVFRRLVSLAQLRVVGGRAPTLHGLRHTFAVRALETTPTGRSQVGQSMRALATYLGHVSIVSTYWYLEATPELLIDVATASERFMSEGQP
ncbi:MAG: tyrosine-type recombinase/integrase [Longimicrobiales bacterium]